MKVGTAVIVNSPNHHIPIGWQYGLDGLRQANMFRTLRPGSLGRNEILHTGIMLFQIGANQTPTAVQFHRQPLRIFGIAIVPCGFGNVFDRKVGQGLHTMKLRPEDGAGILRIAPIIQIPIVKGGWIIKAMKNIHVRPVHKIMCQHDGIFCTGRTRDTQVGWIVILQNLNRGGNPRCGFELCVIIDATIILGTVLIGRVGNFIKRNVILTQQSV
mmetsp:Transcript_26246/g.54821  ORF Transcript_26246/g.54821 Transcript_26246/m.54821 type:complete len:214 (+) Transcript_26246:2508-3149(+)